ncbi:hypothetical protein [Rhizomonospora bruguierae]|uniref:hypothetical protein n=1 Tax=Rhizomonospora bruguierae TaxID=1581705 RepID=UPI001BD1682D|nr:hypothetical protein [Micromonospora sp. NBRC 107566]
MGFLAGGLVGLLAGFIGGRLTERTRRARADYRAGRGAVPGLRKAAWGHLEKAVRVWAVVGIVLAAVVVYLVKYPTS